MLHGRGSAGAFEEIALPGVLSRSMAALKTSAISEVSAKVSVAAALDEVGVADLDWLAPDYAPVWQARSARLALLQADAQLLSAVKAHYREEPVAFISDWLCTFDPRHVEVGGDALTPFVLFERQAECVRWLVARWRSREDGLVEKSRDMGVSWLCVAVAVWMWLFHPGVVIGFGSRKEEYVDKVGDPKSLFWKVRTALQYLPREFLPKGYDEKRHAPAMRIINPENGAVMVGEAGSNIGRGNRTSIYFKDESAFYEQPEAIEAALSQTSNCKIDVSTPNGVGNPFYRKRHGGRVPVFVFDWRDDPRKGADWYARQQALLDAVVLAQEVDRNYAASVSNTYIPGDVVSQCMRCGPADVHALGPLQVGVDVARFGDDKSVITLRQGRVVFPQVVFGQADVVDVAGRVKDVVHDWGGVYSRQCGAGVAQIAVDTIGIGAGVADILRREFGPVVVDVNSALRLSDGQNYNLRARLWRDLRDYLKAGASLPNDAELQTDLSALRYSYRGGALLMESKEDAKRRGVKSPDRADSLALTFAYPVSERQERLPTKAVANFNFMD